MQLQSFFPQDDAGNLLTGGTATVYLKGTQTLATGLADAAGNPVANPVPAAASGRIQFRAPMGDYDVLLEAAGFSLQVEASFMEAAVEPAAGSVPISRSDSTLHPDWIAGEYSAALVGHISYAIDIAAQAAGAVNGGEVRVESGAADRPSICLAANPGTGIFFPADDEIAFAINGVEVLRIDSSGIV